MGISLKAIALLCSLMAASLTSINVKAVVIDFDSLEVANSSLNSLSAGIYTEDGFTITGSPMYYAGQLNNLYAGSAGMHMRSSGAAISLTISAGGTVFNLDSIDLSILRNGATSPPVTFTADLSGGGTVSQTFTPTAFGFNTFNFTGFNSVTSVTWNQGSSEGNAHQFDNIAVNSQVSAPATAGLFLIGLLGARARSKRNAR